MASCCRESPEGFALAAWFRSENLRRLASNKRLDTQTDEDASQSSVSSIMMMPTLQLGGPARLAGSCLHTNHRLLSHPNYWQQMELLFTNGVGQMGLMHWCRPATRPPCV